MKLDRGFAPIVALAALVAGLALPAAAADEHVMLTPDKIDWQPGPAILPQGAEAAVLFGNPAEEGPFALRLKVPEGYVIPPHTHPAQEVVTVLSGSFRLAMGETAEIEEAEPLPAGSFFALPPGMVHHVRADEETVIQINTIGPWALEYVDPEDDPRS